MESLISLYKRAEQFIFHGLWQKDPHKRGPLGLLYRTLRLLFVLARDVSDGQINLRAMSLVYTTLLSLVPLLAVSFSVLKAFGVHNQVEPFLFRLVEPLGDEGTLIVTNIMGFVENMRVGVLGFIGLAMLIYTVISLIQKIEEAFNYVWHTKQTRSFSRRFTDYLSVIMVGPLLVISAMGITASLYNSHFLQKLLEIEPFGTLIFVAGKVMPFFFVIAAFTFFYIFVPNTKVRIGSALLGATVGGILWQLSGMLFASFVAGSARYAAIYSGFAILILFMIWLYLSWLILLFGSQLAYLHQHPEQIRLNNERIPLSGRLKEQVGLTVLYLITCNFVRGEKGWSLDDLSERLELPGDSLMEVIIPLERTGYLTESASEPNEFLLARAPERMSIQGVLDTLRHDGEESMLLDTEALAVEPLDLILSELNATRDAQLAGRTVRDLVVTCVEDDDDNDCCGQRPEDG